MLTAETVWEANGHACILFEFIDAPHIEDLDLSEDETVRMGHELVARIADIGGDELPTYVDVGSEGKWQRFVTSTLADLQTLVDLDRFEHVTSSTVRELDRLARNQTVLQAAEINPGLVHGDLGGDNVFRCGDGYKVIDWQRPIRGPRELDLMVFISHGGFDPLNYISPGIAAIHVFLSVHWLTQCKERWIPDATSYDQVIANAPDKMRHFLARCDKTETIV